MSVEPLDKSIGDGVVRSCAYVFSFKKLSKGLPQV